ncbi:phospholipase D-like domain-containing protein [Paenibacillus polymyxa]|uniref:phospholipase D n=1 Tax=Paenibacillus polymyxa TaxID=1406 RepID=A0AAE9L959_PAEPO|nr:phospholipase D-like domain-containing protein [Paenibacillus polymyxa]URJ51896.1 phospholipase D-like domain-containing protein [Paenibacillus polymyxa]
MKSHSLTYTVASLAGEVYIETTPGYSLWGLSIKPKPVDLDEAENNEHNAHFFDVKDTITQGIRNAKYTIWIAVAWFTDNEIYNELILRKRAGVQIRIITSDEETNHSLMKKLESNFETVKVPKVGTNRLHDKFCIIDFEYMIHGSYNWSKNAMNNEEILELTP